MRNADFGLFEKHKKYFLTLHQVISEKKETLKPVSQMTEMLTPYNANRRNREDKSFLIE